MKIIALAISVFLSLISANSFAKDDGTRGAVYDLDDSVLTITEKSLKQIDRADNGEHASKILKGEVPMISIREAAERIQASRDMFHEKVATFSPTSNLLIEFEGRVTDLVVSHICNGRDGKYLTLSIPNIYSSEDMPVSIDGKEKTIKQLIISTDPSNALLLRNKLLWGAVGDYWRFFLKRIDYDSKFKVTGLINYAGQRSEKNEIERLELMITIIKISTLP